MGNDNHVETQQTVAFSMAIAGKLKGHLANFDQVDEALQIEPENEELQKLRTDLLEVIRLVSKELIRSEWKVDAQAKSPTPGIPRGGCSTSMESNLNEEIEYARLQQEIVPKMIEVVVTKNSANSDDNEPGLQPPPEIPEGQKLDAISTDTDAAPESSNSLKSMSFNARKNRRHRLNQKMRPEPAVKPKISKTSSTRKRVGLCFKTFLRYQVTKSELLKYIDKIPKSLSDT